jgi:protein-tyrosine phosphatase
MQVLVVCTANVARSPLVAAMLAARLPADVTVISAGVHAYAGAPAAEGSRMLAEARGLDLTHHRSEAVTADLIASSDLILTMSERQRDLCAPLAPRAASRVFTIRELARLVGSVDVSGGPTDPTARLAWLRDQAHLARPRALPAMDPEDVDDPIRAPWADWEAMAAELEELLDQVLAVSPRSPTTPSASGHQARP